MAATAIPGTVRPALSMESSSLSARLTKFPVLSTRWDNMDTNSSPFPKGASPGSSSRAPFLSLTDPEIKVMETIFRHLRANRPAPSIDEIAAETGLSFSFSWKTLGTLQHKNYLRRDKERSKRGIVPILECAICKGNGRVIDPEAYHWDVPANLKEYWLYLVKSDLETGVTPTTREIAAEFGVSPGRVRIITKHLEQARLTMTEGEGRARGKIRVRGVIPCPDCVMMPQPWEEIRP